MVVVEVFTASKMILFFKSKRIERYKYDHCTETISKTLRWQHDGKQKRLFFH